MMDREKSDSRLISTALVVPFLFVFGKTLVAGRYSLGGLFAFCCGYAFLSHHIYAYLLKKTMEIPGASFPYEGESAYRFIIFILAVLCIVALIYFQWFGHHA